MARQTARILSLDVDGGAFPEVGRRDEVVGALQARYPGLRPVRLPSPYEAAAWAVLSVRVRMPQAARIKTTMARALGGRVAIHGDVRHAFPAPARLAELAGFPGLFGRKLEFLRALGRAACEGALDAARLRSLPAEDALRELRALPGIGPFSAELVLLRGAGEPDYAPGHEPRLRRAIARAFVLAASPSDEDLRSLSDGWRPYRTWVSFLLRRSLDEESAGGEAG